MIVVDGPVLPCPLGIQLCNAMYLHRDGIRRIANERIANETDSNWDELHMNEVPGSGQGSVRKVAVKRVGSVWEVHGNVWEVGGEC